MDTTTAAQRAGVTAATIRTWCRKGVVAAIKCAGRWIINASSLAYRITIGKERRVKKIQPLTRTEFEAATRARGITAPFKDQRCYGEYKAYQQTGRCDFGGEYGRLMVARGAALAAEGYTPPAPRRGPGYAPGLPGDMFGAPGPDRADECHYCGLPLNSATGECDDCR